MGLLKKVENDDRGLDISLFGTALILMTFVSFCSVFDYWVLTFAKEQIISKVEVYEFNALASHVDFNQPGFAQDFEGYFAAAAIEEEVEETFYNNFSKGIAKTDGLIFNVALVDGKNQVNCYPNPVTKKITLESGTVRFQVRRLLKGTSRVPFMGGTGKNYLKEAVYSSVKTNIVFLFKD